MKYLRVLLTNKCNLSCEFCHGEGCEYSSADIDEDILCEAIEVLYKIGYRKIKLMGGEPMLYPSLSSIVEKIKKNGGDIDLSMISNGSADINHYKSLIITGLDRLNISIHGWRLDDFIANTKSSKTVWQQIRKNIECLARNHGINKVNYVLKKGVNEEDFFELVEFACEYGLVIDALNLLVDSNESYQRGLQYQFNEIEELISKKYTIFDKYEKENLFSLPSKRLVLKNGAEINLKINKLNQQNVFYGCSTCKYQADCIEGIKAIRITNKAMIQPCLLRTDNCYDLKKSLNPEDIINYLTQL